VTAAPEGPIGAIAHYSLLERLEPRGPGDLYRARDTHVGRTVVVRVLPAEFTPDAPARNRLIARARAGQVVSHPNVSALFDVGECQGRVYVVFEFLKGQPLRAEMAGRPMNVRRAVDLAVQVAGAVADLHAAGLPSPGLSPDAIVVTSKGLAKVAADELAALDGFEEDGSARLRNYESPEELNGRPGDERSDAYSVGAVLFEMLTARRPSPKGAAAPSASNASVPTALDQVVLKAIAPNPERRVQSASILLAELRQIVGSGMKEQERAHPPVAAARRGGGGWLLAVVVLVLVVGAAWWYFVLRS